MQPNKKNNSENKKPVVLQVLPSMHSGGVERGTLEIAKGCTKNQIECLVASSGGKMADNLSRFNVKHIKLPLSSKNPLTILRNIKKLTKIIKENKVNIIHARSRAPAWSAYYAAKKNNCKFVTTFHGVYSITGDMKKKYNSIMLKGDRVIVASEFIEKHILKNYEVDKNILRLISRGVDTEIYDIKKFSDHRVMELSKKLNLNYEHPVILLPGRLTQWKGQEFLIDALIKMKDINYQCLIAGDDKNHSNYKARLQKKIDDAKLGYKIKFIGNIEDMPVLYSLSDVVISSSLRPEAFGRIAIEAQAVGKPVIATSHGGSLETIINGKTGWLVDPNNVDQLVSAIRSYFELDYDCLNKMSEDAKKHIKQNFSLESMINKTIDVYKEVLK